MKRHASILKNSIEQMEVGSDFVFLMKDTASLEQAIEQGAERFTDKTQIFFGYLNFICYMITSANMIYVPCVATIAALIRETGWKNAALITFSEIGLAVLLGGITFRVLGLFM